MPAFLKNTSCVAFFLLTASALYALPEIGQVVSGQVECHADDLHSLQIHVSDKAIINYPKFDIGVGEHVQFIQPSQNATVLNRVIAKNPSKILGKLSANGRVFLVNPSGIYVGPTAVVNVGSFVASSLNIRDEDFLNDKFQFYHEPGSEKSSVINEGLICASPEGFVALFAPMVENRGSIIAKAGKVALASTSHAERVTLDFHGDGLIRFTLEDDLKEAVLASYSQIESAGGSVELLMNTAQDAIKRVVNTDGLAFVNAIEEVDGIVRLVSTSRIVANAIELEGEHVAAGGVLDASNDKSGGSVRILGDKIGLVDAHITTSGETGGGEVLIGGDYQGKGDLRRAQFTTMDELSTIESDAKINGNGGKVILWSDDTTLFDGKIYARGGEWRGNGGFVETSGKMQLGSETGYVNTLSSTGQHGLWLLDPNTININSNGGGTITNASNCPTSGTVNISSATINGAVSNVALCAQSGVNSSITVNNAVSMTNAGIGLSLTAGSTNLGTITLNAGITTKGGAIGLTGVVALGAAVVLDTTNTAPGGANVNFTNTINGAQNLVVNGGTNGVVTLTGAVGGTTALTSLSAVGGTITQSSTVKTTGALNYTGASAINVNGNITTSGGAVTLTGPVVISGNPLIDSTNAGAVAGGANISFSNTLNGATALTIRAGTGGIATFTGAIGGTTPLTNLSFTSASSVRVGNNVTVSGANPLVFNTPVSLIGTSNITSNNANSTFSNTLNGAQALTLTAGTGTVLFSGAVGGVTPLNNLTFASANLVQVGNNITLSGANPLVFSTPVSLTGTSNITSNNANITFSSSLNGAQALTLAGGTGTILFSGAIGGGVPLNSLTATGGIITQSSTAQIAGPISYTGPTAINLAGNIKTSSGVVTLAGPIAVSGSPVIDSTNAGGSPFGASISLTSTLNGAIPIVMNAGTGGTVSMGGAIGGITPPTSLNVTGLIITQNSSVKTAGAITYTAPGSINVGGAITTSGSTINLTGPVVISGNPTIDTTNGGTVAAGANINFSNIVNGSSALTLRAGTGGIPTFSGAVGEVNALTNLSFTSANFIQIGSNIVVSGANPLTFPFPVQLTSTSNITTNNAAVSFNSTINGGSLNVIAGSGSILFTGAVGGTTPPATLAIASANNVTANTITAGVLSQSSGSGTSTFNGPVSTTGALGINLTGNAFTFNNTVTTTGSGGVAIANSGLLTMPFGSNFTLSGSFSQTGLGGVRAGNTVSTGDNLSVAGPVSLTHAASFTTASKQITFSNTIDSLSTTPFDLTLDAGTSNILLQGNVGSNFSLATFLLNHANNITMQGLAANTATLNGGTGTMTVNGDVTVGSGGVQLTGNNFINNGNVITTNGGSVTLNNTGTATRTPGHTTVVDGNYTLNGPGPAFAGSSLTAKGNILIVPAVTLVSNATVDTSSGGGNITFSSTINGAPNLTLKAGTGTISINGNVGSLVPIGNLQIVSANHFTSQGIQATSITQTAGTGTTTFNGALVTSGPIAINTNAIVRGAAITTTAGGSLTITNSGTFTSTAAGAINLAGAFNQNGAGNVQLSGAITAANSNISFSSPITLSGAVSLSTGSGSGNITLNQTVQGAFGLTLNAGTGNITLGGNIGTITPLTAFTITNGASISTQAITSAFITQTAGTGTTTFNGALNTTGATGLSLTGTSFTFNNTYTTSGVGPLTLTNSGLVTFSGVGSIAAGVTQTGSGSIQLSSSMTSAGAMQFNGPFAVSGTGSLSTSNQPITFFSTLNGPGNLTLSPGTGNLSVGGNAGAISSLGNVIITSANNVTTQAITAASITQQAGSGATIFNGDIGTTGTGGIQLTGNIFSMFGNMTAGGLGGIQISNAGALNTTSGKTITGNGGFAQTGSGSVNLASHVATQNTALSFASPITLTSNVMLNSGSSLGDITVGAVDGAYGLTFNAGRDIFASALGGTISLSDVVISSVRNATFSSISAASIVQQAGSGTTSFTGNIATSAPGGIVLVGTDFSCSGSVTTINNGPFQVTNTGTFTGSASNPTTIDGAFSQIASGLSSSVNLAGTITARQGISLSSPVTLTSNVILDTSIGNANIALTGTVDNNLVTPYSFTLRSGSGNITLGNAIGLTQPIGPFILGPINNLSAAALSVSSIGQEALTTLAGTGVFNGAIVTTGIDLSGNAFTFNNSVTTTSGGSVALANTGLLTIGSAFNLDGSFAQTGSGSVSFGGSVVTTNDPISFTGPITLTGPSILNSGAGAGDITLSGTLNGASTLSVTSGTGDMTCQSTIGQITPLTSLTIPSSNSVNINSNTTITGGFTITSAAGPSTLNGTLQAGSISITGAAITLNEAITSSAGPISITNSGTLSIAALSPITSATSFIQSGAGSVLLGSNISTTGTLSLASPVTLASNTHLNSGGGNLTLSNTVAGLFDLTLTAGSGDILISGAIGAPRIGIFTINSVNNLTVQSITASSMTLINATGTATLQGSLDTNALSGITLNGNSFISSGTITTSNGGPLTVTNSGLVTATGSSVITLNGGGSFIQNGSGLVNLGGTVTTQNAVISHTSPVHVLLPTTFSSSGGDIVFSNTVEGPACLTLNAGSGDVVLDGPVGATTPLGCLNATGLNIFQHDSVDAAGSVQETGSISLSGDITTNGSDIVLTGNVTTTATAALTSGGGDITITGTVNGNIAGRGLTLQAAAGDVLLSSSIGNAVPFNSLTISGNNITWSDLGSTVFGSTGVVTLSALADITFTGMIYKNGTQNYTAGGQFNFTAGVPISIISSVEPITFSTGTIQLGTTDLTIQSFGGNVTLTSLLGAGRNLVVDADTGAMNFAQIGASGQNLNNVTLTANAFSPTPISNVNVFANSLTVSSSTPQIISSNQTIANVTYNAPIIIDGNIAYTCGSAGTIIFNNKVDANMAGVDTLSFDFSGCSGSILFNGPVGAVAPLASLSINQPTNVSTASQVNVGELSITNGLGTTSISSGITTTQAGGITIATPAISMAGSITTAGSGPLILNNSGALTIASGTVIDVAGAFQQIGTGSVAIGGSVITHNSALQMTGATTLNGPLTLQSSGGDILFASTLGGVQNLTIDSGSGDINFNASVGPLADIEISNADQVTASGSLSATSLTQLSSSGTSTFGALSTTGVNGINLIGNQFAFNGNITTTNGGSLTIDNTGSISFGNGVRTIGGALTQSGLGPSSLAGTFTTGGAIFFANGVTLSGPATFDTSANSRDITFNSTLSGANALTLNAGSGTINCVGVAGVTPLGTLTITNTGNANFSSISAAGLIQTAGSGTTTISGNISTSQASGVNLTGTGFNISGSVATAAAGPFTISNTGALSLNLSPSTLVTGPFSQSGGGAVSFSGLLSTSNQNISFANDMTLIGAATLSSGGGLITLSSTVDGNFPFNLSSGGGNISFGADLGGIAPLGALTISSVNNITYPQVHAASLVQAASIGATIITGPLFVTAPLGVSITGTNITQNGAITTTGSGSVAFIHTGLFTASASVITEGSYTESGGGGFNLGDDITAGGIISFADDTVLTSGIALAGSNIISASSITGAQALSMTAQGGSIILSGDVGTLATPLTSWTVVEADTVSTLSVYADFITQQIGTGSTSFNGVLNSSTASGILLTGTDFTFNGLVASNGDLSLSNAGLAQFSAAATGSIIGDLVQNGVGTTQLSNTMTIGGQASFTGPVSTSGSSSLTTTNQDITFFDAVDGPGNLTLATGTGDIIFEQDVGGSLRLGSLTLTTVNNLTAGNITATSITQSSGSGQTVIHDNLNTNGAGGISLNGATITLLGDVTTTGSGPVMLTNSNTLTFSDLKTISSDGTFTQNGSGPVLLAGTVLSNNDINFSGSSPITLTAPVTIDSSSGGGDLNFGSSTTVDGHFPLTLTAGAGDVNILGNFGGVTRLGALTVTSTNNLQAKALTANSIAQLSGSGTSTLLGSLNTDTPAGITLIGNNFITGPLAASITTTNGGSLTLTNQGTVSESAPVTILVDGSFIQNGPGTIYVGTITARQGFSFTGPVIIPLSATLDSSTGPGSIIFNNTINGMAGTESLILNASTANITISQPIGATTALGSFTATGGTITIQNIGTPLLAGVANSTTLTASNEVVFTGTTYNAHTQTYNGSATFELISGGLTTFNSNGNPLSFLPAGILLGSGTDLAMNTGGASLTLGSIHAQTGNHRSLTLNAGVGSIQISDMGTLGGGEFASGAFTSNNLTLGHIYADAFTFGYTGTLNAGGDIFSNNTPLAFPNPVVLQSTNIFSSSGGSITFSSTLNGSVANTYGLTLNAGAGNINFIGTIGAVNRLSNLTVASATNATFSTTNVASLIQQSGSGTTTFNGPVIVPGVIGVILTGNNFTFNSTVQTLNNASLNITNSGTVNFAGSANLSGALTQGPGPVTFSGSITAGQPISFGGIVTLSGTPSLNTAAANQMISFQNIVNGSGALTLNAGSGGNIAFNSTVGSLLSPIGALTITNVHDVTAQSIYANSIQQVASSGQASYLGTLSTSGASGIHLTGTNITLNAPVATTGGGSLTVSNAGLLTSSNAQTLDGAYIQNGSGPVHFQGSITTNTGPISFASSVALLGTSNLNTSASNQNITFSNILDGPGSLTLTAGEGDITFAQLVGFNTPLSSLAVTSAHNINLYGIGSTANGIFVNLDLHASNNINYTINTCSAGKQSYFAGGQTLYTAGAPTTLTSFGGPITFVSGPLHLSSGTDLLVMTNDGDFSFQSILGSNLEDIIIFAGAGVAALNTISSPGTITSLIVDAGPITFSGPITADHISCTALEGISNTGLPVLIVSPSTVSFNALGGNVGTLTSPIYVQTGGQIFAGASGLPTLFLGATQSTNSLVNFNGTSVDNTVNVIASNPPCKVIFNNVAIQDCTSPFPPSPPNPSGPNNAGQKIPEFLPFAVPGFDSSFFNLASDFFFFNYFLDERYVRKDVYIMYR